MPARKRTVLLYSWYSILCYSEMPCSTFKRTYFASFGTNGCINCYEIDTVCTELLASSRCTNIHVVRQPNSSTLDQVRNSCQHLFTTASLRYDLNCQRLNGDTAQPWKTQQTYSSGELMLNHCCHPHCGRMDQRGLLLLTNGHCLINHSYLHFLLQQQLQLTLFQLIPPYLQMIYIV